MQLALLPVVEDLLSEELGAAPVEEVVEDAEEEEGALEEEVDVGPVDRRGIFRMLLGIAVGGILRWGGEEIVKEIAYMNFGKETHLLFLAARNATQTVLAPNHLLLLSMLWKTMFGDGNGCTGCSM